MNKKPIFYTAVLVVGISTLFLSGCKKKASKQMLTMPTPVSVEEVRNEPMSDLLNITGDLKALNDVTLSPKISGKVIRFTCREGDRVSAGQIVAQLDTSDLSAQVAQAKAAVLSARARLRQAQTAVTIQDTQVETDIGKAKAALESAKSNLAIVKAGARSQERLVAQNSVDSAKASMDNEKLNLDRVRNLYTQGAVSKQSLDNALMQYTVASRQYDSAVQQLSLIHVGARPEEINAAEANVKQANEQLKMAYASRNQKIARRDDVQAAKAVVAEAEASLSYAKTQLANASIRTPISGVLSKRLTEPGQMASPGAAVAQVVALNSVYLDANASEMDIARVKLGQMATVRVDALPNQVLKGTVIKVLPTANAENRKFSVRIALDNGKNLLHPGMFARAQVEVEKHPNAMIIPKDALVEKGNTNYVFVVENNIAKLRPVETGITSTTEIEILRGVTAHEKVITLGQDGLQDGAKVEVR